MKYAKISLILAAALSLAACSDSTSSSSSETAAPVTSSSAPVAQTEPVQTESSVSVPIEQTDIPEGSGGLPGGISIENSYSELKSLCTLLEEDDVYAEFEDSGLEYYSRDMPDFSAYYSIPDELPETLQTYIASGGYPDVTPAQFYAGVESYIYDNCNIYCLVKASDETFENMIFDIWQVPISGGEPTKLSHIETIPNTGDVDPFFYTYYRLIGANEKYILYDSFSNPYTDMGYHSFVYCRETDETIELPEECFHTFLMGSAIYYYGTYTITVLGSDYSLPIIYKYYIPTGAVSVHKFNADLLYYPNSSLLVYSGEDGIILEDSLGNEWRYTPNQEERYFITGSNIAIAVPTDENEVLGNKHIIGRQLNEIRQEFVKTAYNVYPRDVSFSDGHFMGFILTRYTGDDNENYQILYDKRGNRLMQIDFAEDANSVCSDGKWMYYYGGKKVAAINCE